MREQSTVHSYFAWFLLFSCGWWIVLIPLDYNLFDFLLQPVQNVFKELISSSGTTKNFASDGTGMYVLLLCSLILAAISAFGARLFKRNNNLSPQNLSHNLITFFLGLILLKYGWIKIMKLQFYLPEPNILYSRFGSLSKDIAYWALIGTSRIYSISTGSIEVVAGFLLIFKRTRLIGFLLSTGIFANVLLINLSFDISVKLFSATLLLFSIFGLFYYKDRLKVLVGFPLESDEKKIKAKSSRASILKSLVVTVIVLEAVFPSIVSESLNDDTAVRPEFHGAYNVIGNDSWLYLYIHRSGYLILEDNQNNQFDYKITGKSGGIFSLKDERTGQKGRVHMSNSFAIINMGRSDTLTLLQLPYRTLPLMNETVHPFSDLYH